MRKIKLLLVTWIVALLSITSMSIAQEKITPKPDTLTFGIEVKTDPVTVTVNTEELGKNEALQQVVTSLDSNLNKLNQTLASQEPEPTQLDILSHYDIDLKKISEQERLVNGIWWIATFIYILIVLYWVTIKRRIYFTKSMRPTMIFTSVGTILLLGYIMPSLFKSLFIENYELWQNVSKLF